MNIWLRRFHCVALALVASAAGLCAADPLTEKQVRDSRPAADQGLARYKRLLNASNHVSQGFKTLDDARRATLGTPWRTAKLPVNLLRIYKPGQPVSSLIETSTDLLYPIMVRREVVTSLTLWLDRDQWRTSDWGPAARIQKLTEVARRVRPPRGSELVAVEVPLINAWFLGVKTGANDMRLYATQDLPWRKVGRARIMVVQEEDLRQLSELAKRYDGQPN